MSWPRKVVRGRVILSHRVRPELMNPSRELPHVCRTLTFAKHLRAWCGSFPKEEEMETAEYSSNIQDETLRRITWRLIPFMMLLYFIAFLDRANVGFAAMDMNRDLNISKTLYGFGSGAFFLGYFFFELPSNLLLHRFGARKWIARIMISWGIVSGATALVVGAKSYITIRILLGVAEAGSFPA